MINDALLNAVSWTLVHSLWQGFLLALTAALIILATKKTSAALRYKLLTLSFVAFLAGTIVTFIHQFQSASLLNGGFSGIANSASLLESGLLERVTRFLNENTQIIALVWFVVFVVKCIGVFGDLTQLYRIRNYQIYAPADFWQSRLNELSKRIGLRKSVRLLESKLVNVPSVTGIFKPMILVPIGLLAHLPADQAEAILLHELAHIKRRDFGMNLIQHFAEIVFFFNPGVLWLSAVIRDERENCCDDIAISVTNSKTEFVSALVSFGQYQLDNTLALGFAGRKNHLLSRAKRLLSSRNQSLNQVEKAALSFGIVILATLLLSYSTGEKTNMKSTVTTILPTYVPGVFQTTLQGQGKAECIALSDETKTEISRSVKTTSSTQTSSSLESAQTKADAEQIAQENLREQRGLSRLDAERARLENLTQSEDKKRDIRSGISHDASVKVYREDVSERIVAELIAEHVIANRNNLSYKVSKTDLVVNGVVQPVNLHRKIREKYVDPNINTLVYNYDISTTVTTGD